MGIPLNMIIMSIKVMVAGVMVLEIVSIIPDEKIV